MSEGSFLDVSLEEYADFFGGRLSGREYERVKLVVDLKCFTFALGVVLKVGELKQMRERVVIPVGEEDMYVSRFEGMSFDEIVVEGRVRLEAEVTAALS